VIGCESKLDSTIPSYSIFPNSYTIYRLNRGERNGLGRREKRPEKIRETGETTLKNREKGEPAWKGRRGNIIFLKLVIIFSDISLCL